MCAKFKQLKLVLSAAKSINKQSVSISVCFSIIFKWQVLDTMSLGQETVLISGVFITPNTEMKIKDLVS